MISIKDFNSRIWKWVLTPFTEDWLFFTLLFLLLEARHLYFYDRIPIMVYMGMKYYILVYLLSLFTGVIKPIGSWVKLFSLLFALVYCLSNFYCLITYNCFLSFDFIEIIAGTNLDEATEFFKTFVSWVDIYLFMFAFIAVPVAYFAIRKKSFQLPERLSVVMLFLLIPCCIGLIHNPGIITNSTYSNRLDEIVDLREHPTNPTLVATDSIFPQNIIVIIGESFSKNHSSLYGYSRNTNPLLKRKRDEGNLITFENVTAPASTTTRAFKFLLTSVVSK